MKVQSSKFKVQSLRKDYPKFIYEKYSYRISKNNLEILFDFKIKNLISFKPKIVIENIPPEFKNRILNPVRNRRFLNGVNNLIFHLGLIEIPSYWKATCSPVIEIQAGPLNKEQLRWWKDLIINGMGQFFYENKIDWRKKDFIKIISKSNEICKRFDGKLKNRFLVPFAGGRDSIVTLESLKSSSAKASEDNKKNIALFLVNPNEQIKKVAKATSVKKQIIVRRIIDKKLLDLNKRGFLNGHTPFTSVLSFLSVACAAIFNYKHIVFSNEKSADEGNVKYLGKIINHQWAKSSEFEKIFKSYCKKYLAKEINYFSFLRKYGELEISKMLTKYPKYFSVFSSCNASMRIDARQIRWCGNCPKCLFVYATLYPYLNKKQLLKIFGKDFFENRGLLPITKGLIDKKTPKPFECVGTKKESQLVFKLSFKKAKKTGRIPYLLTKIK